MKWTVSLPRTVAEDDRCERVVYADSIEEAITKACAAGLHGRQSQSPITGQAYNVHARVEVVKRPSLPLRSV